MERRERLCVCDAKPSEGDRGGGSKVKLDR